MHSTSQDVIALTKLTYMAVVARLIYEGQHLLW